MQQLPLQLLALSIGDPNEFLISKNYISREFDHQLELPMVRLKKFVTMILDLI